MGDQTIKARTTRVRVRHPSRDPGLQICKVGTIQKGRDRFTRDTNDQGPWTPESTQCQPPLPALLTQSYSSPLGSDIISPETSGSRHYRISSHSVSTMAGFQFPGPPALKWLSSLSGPQCTISGNSAQGDEMKEESTQGKEITRNTSGHVGTSPCVSCLAEYSFSTRWLHH